MNDDKEKYAAWLEKANHSILETETRAKACLAQTDYAQAYKDLMIAKAELIRRLPAEFGREFPGEDAASRAAWENIMVRLANFAQSAENSLAIGSPFYMSALLYPDEHQPGEPNNLELLIAEMKRQ